ncbi:transcriptional regulator, Fur family [Selenomonas sputigena ATCC 35185]|uniref:Transcriptional regulator, Fur family n=1 Tax=Selenomonas sputigena (strain ATCC 35185 / DSM 20758 / CCUG 44933 / VPI D19B-28) TaxID=546271 RepID=C9LRZ4_SELS3|nr:transcriptional regulator, Fur family [Selenomonas sputigena ATCC 35185]
MRRKHSNVSLDTIYRNLALLSNLGVIHEIYRAAGNVYEIIEPGHHHHHLVCTECGKTECIDICPMQEAYTKEAEKRGFLITGHIFEFYGICQECREKNGL